MNFLNTVNPYGQKFWYVNGKRTTYSKYCIAVKQCQKLECFKTETKNGYIRQFATGILK